MHHLTTSRPVRDSIILQAAKAARVITSEERSRIQGERVSSEKDAALIVFHEAEDDRIMKALDALLEIHDERKRSHVRRESARLEDILKGQDLRNRILERRAARQRRANEMEAVLRKERIRLEEEIREYIRGRARLFSAMLS